MSPAPGSARPMVGASAALLYVVFFVGSLALPGLLGQNGHAPLVTPYSTDADVAHYLAVAPRGGVPVASFCQAMSALALLLFVPYAAQYVRRMAAGDVFAGLVRAFGTVAGAFLLLSASLQWVLDQPGTATDLQVYRALMDAVFITGAAAQVATTGVLVGAVAGAARSRRELPGWHTGLGLGVAAVSVLSMLSLLAEWATVFIPLGRFVGMAWFLALGVTLLRRGSSGRARPLPATNQPQPARG